MADAHPNTRLEAFCDGVFAIALTLLIIDIKIPSSEVIGTTREMWLALRHLTPSILAFVVSFAIILITWVNHHAAFKLVNKSSASFMYANGFLLLSVVFLPFPTALVGDTPDRPCRPGGRYLQLRDGRSGGCLDSGIWDGAEQSIDQG